MDQTPPPADREPGVPAPPAPTLLGMLGEAIDLGAGLTVMLLPLLTTALPGVVLLLVLPAALLALVVAVPAALAAAFLAPPYMLVRAVRRRRRAGRAPVG
jgi:Flp pilus assembly protein TadB